MLSLFEVTCNSSVYLKKETSTTSFPSKISLHYPGRKLHSSLQRSACKINLGHKPKNNQQAHGSRTLIKVTRLTKTQVNIKGRPSSDHEYFLLLKGHSPSLIYHTYASIAGQDGYSYAHRKKTFSLPAQLGKRPKGHN